MVTARRLALAACAMTSWVGMARAQSSQLELTWTAPDGCPDAEVVRKRAERILGRPLARAGETPLTISAVVTPASEAQPWSVTLETDSGQRRASRTVQAASCDELASAAALFVAILLEPSIGDAEPADGDAARSEAESVPPDSPRASAEPPPVAAATAEQASARRSDSPASTSRWALGAVAGARSGLVPGWAFGLGVHGSWSWRLLRTSVGASFWLPVRETLDAEQAAGAELQLSSGYSELCAQIETGPLVPALCAGGELSVLRGKGFGPGVQPEAGSAAFVSLLGGATVSVPLSEQASLLLDGDVLLPLGQRQFVLAGSDPALVFAPSAGFRLTCGAEWSF